MTKANIQKRTSLPRIIHKMGMSTQTRVRLGFLFLIALLDGVVDSCLGPALRDLQCIFNVTLQKVSLFHPVVTVGRVLGSLLFLKIPGRFNIYGVAATTMTTTCCIFAAVPVIPMFWIALALSGGAGVTNGITIYAIVLLSGELSKEHAASIHIINLAMTAGQFAGPLVISQFLSDNVYHIRSDINNGSIYYYSNSTFVSQNSSLHPGREFCRCFNSDVKYGFFAIGGLGVLLAPLYLLAQKSFQNDISTSESQLRENSAKTMSVTDSIYLFIVMIYTIVCGNMIFVYGQFLPTFGIHSRLHASTKIMANMSTSFYACMMIGRLLGTVCSLLISQSVLINVCTAAGIIMSVTLVCVSEKDITWLWVGTGILSVVCGPVFPAVQTWALDNNAHRNVLYSISSIAVMVGYAGMSLLTGQLMATIFIQMLNYVMFVVSLVQLLSIMILYLIMCKKVQSQNQGYSDIE